MPPKIPFYKSSQHKSHAQPYIIYDASIKDLEERIKEGKRFETATETAQFLGLRKIAHLNTYSDKEAILAQKKFKSKKHNKLFIIRKDSN